MRWALLFALSLTAWGADAPRVIFSKDFPGSTPAFFSISVDQTGATTYNESSDPDNGESLSLQPGITRQIFDLAQRLDHFNRPLESGLKVANMGMKTMRWEDGAEKTETKFNYSSVEDAKALADLFERISESTRMLLDLNRVTKHDRLGVDQATRRIAAAWESKRLVGTLQLLTALDQVAQNEAFIHMARERAARVADAIRASTP